MGQTAKQPTRTKKKINNNNQKNSADGNELNGPRTDRIAAGGAQQQQRKRAGPKFQQLTQQQQQNPVNVTRDGQLSKQAQPTTTPSIAAPKTGKGCLEIDATVTIRRTIDNRKKKPVKAGARVGKRVAMDPVKSEPTAQPPPPQKKKLGKTRYREKLGCHRVKTSVTFRKKNPVKPGRHADEKFGTQSKSPARESCRKRVVPSCHVETTKKKNLRFHTHNNNNIQTTDAESG